MVVIEVGCMGDYKEDEEDWIVVFISVFRNRRWWVENWIYIFCFFDDIVMEVLCCLFFCFYVFL